MEFSNDCRFCNIINGKYQFNEIDQPFASNHEFIAVASIGAMIEGWSLIIPKEHQLSMKNIYLKSTFINFAKFITQIIINKYGPLISFEHGSNKEGSITACGTDHAHLHFVPYKKSMLGELHNSNFTWELCHSSEIPSIVQNNEYLFYSEIDSEDYWKNPEGYLHILETPISQYFRQLIAKRIGRKDTSDYRKFPYLNYAFQTRQSLINSIS